MKIRSNDLTWCSVATDLLIGFAAAIVIAAPGPGVRTTLCMANENKPHALQGYGRVTLEAAEAGGGPAVFRCEDDAAADRLLSKLLADFSWDRVTGPQQHTLADGVSVLKVQPRSLLLFARQGSTVYALSGDSSESIESQRTRLGLDLQRAQFKAQRRHPLSMDFFDLRAVSMYYQPLNVLDLAKGLNRYDAEPLEQTSGFWRESGYGHSFFGPYFGLDELADGAEHFFPHQWMIRQAVANDAVVMSHLGEHGAPWWMRNRFPRDIVQWDPYAISGWNGLAAMAGTHLSQHASDKAYAYPQRFARQALDSLKTTAGDHLGCFRETAGGHPGDELALHHASTEYMDYDEAGQRAFRRWLQEARGLDLASLGRRWFNDPDRFRSWDEVTLPSHFEFFGRFGDGSMDLLTDWSWRPDHPQAEAEGWPRPDYREDNSWTPTDLAPSMQQLFLFGSKSDAQLRQGKSTVAWFRKTFDPSTWLAQQPGGEVYVVAQVGDTRNEPVEVFLNANYYYSAIHYMQLEKETGWFSRNRRLLELIGKASWHRPSAAVFRSARNGLYFPGSKTYNRSDPGRGVLQAAHYANVYVTEAEIRAGLIRDYPVVIDAGNAMIDATTLDALTDYVRDGGTLVTVENTGRHARLEPDAWPIARLTGMRVVGTRENMRLEIPADSTHLPHLAGATFQGDGVALALDEIAGSDTISKSKIPEILARWSDGTVAVAIRRMGQGRVVVLGSSFWRSGTERTGDGRQLEQSLQTTLLTDLLTSLGVQRQVDANSEDVWVRRLVTKNGLQQWVVAFNAGRGTVENLTVRIPWAERPQRVVDVVSGQAVEFHWDEGEIRISGLTLPRSAVRVLAVDNPQPLTAVAHWFAEKCRYEERPLEIKATEELTPPPADTIVFRDFRFRMAEGEARKNLAWLDEPTDRPPWTPQGYGFWDEQGQAAQGVGLYRQTFQLPDAWRGRRVLLACMSFDCPVFLGQAEFTINGHAAGQYRGHGWTNFDVLDITPHLVPGENRLAVQVEAEQARGGYLGQLVIYPLENLEDSRDLREGWKLFEDNLHHQLVTLPLQAAGRHLETDVALPADWQGKDVYLEFEVGDRWVGIVVINGRVIAYNQSLHPYPKIMQVNLYPWAKPGQTNRIELWPRTPEDTPSHNMAVERVRIGTVGPSEGMGVATVVRRSPSVVRGSPDRAHSVTDRSPESGSPAPSDMTPVQPEKPGPPVLKDGFEQWSPLSPERQRDAMVQNVILTADHLAPEDWFPGRELGKQKELTGKILPDATVKHSGQYSARLENADLRDITVLQYSTERAEARGAPAILPNRRYVVRWWVKGEQVEKGDAGPILMMNVVSTQQDQTYRTFSSEKFPLPEGTFDWQQRQLTFITDTYAQSAIFSFQLRWATGIIWYDDVELEDLGPVVPVDTY